MKIRGMTLRTVVMVWNIAIDLTPNRLMIAGTSRPTPQITMRSRLLSSFQPNRAIT